MTQDTASLLASLGKSFASSLPDRVAALREAWAQNPPNIVSLRNGAHQLAGTAGCFGFGDVHRSARRIEELLESPSREGRSPDEREARGIESALRALQAEARSVQERVLSLST